jgi:arylsulfatase A-like enzyme
MRRKGNRVKGVNRRAFFRSVSAAAALGLGGIVTATGFGDGWTRQQPKRPNFLFFLIDDMGWKDLGCFGSPFYETPNIDKLAAQGMRFTSAYAACPVCSPTRASIMTGKYPARLGITDWIGAPQKPTPYREYLPLEEITIAEALKEAGYATGYVGKWHLATSDANRARYYPDRQGFDVNIGGDNSGSPPTYFYPYARGKRSLETMPPGGKEGEYLTDRLTEESLKFIEANRDRPFLLYLAHYAVHTPLESKQDLAEKYRVKAAKLPQSPSPLPAYGPYKTRQVQNHGVYAGMVQSVDESVGRVLRKLEELGLEQNTILIFMSDNGGLSTVAREGPTCNLPLRAGKGWLYEGGIREPMIVKWPGVVKAGSECHEPVVSTDFYPTMLEMAGLSPKPGQHLDGLSLVPLLRQIGTLERKAIYWHYPHYHGSGNRPSGAIRAGDYKLIEWYEDGQVELYNLKDDIGERHDLAGTMPEKAAELRQTLHAWRSEVGAKMPEGKPREDYKVWQERTR